MHILRHDGEGGIQHDEHLRCLTAAPCHNIKSLEIGSDPGASEEPRTDSILYLLQNVQPQFLSVYAADRNRFPTGKRRKQSPYELLGVHLPTSHFGSLLKADPDTLT